MDEYINEHIMILINENHIEESYIIAARAKYFHCYLFGVANMLSFAHIEIQKVYQHG